MTRLVEANMNATAATKCAPFIDQRPSRGQCRKGARGADSPESGGQTDAFGILTTQVWREPALGTNACIMALIKYPSTKAQPDFQKKNGGRLGRLAK